MSAESPSAKVLKLGGIEVPFPAAFEPFDQQKAVISKVVVGLRKAENCLIESPTGTGKTLALLCSTLAWQKHHATEQHLELAYETTDADGEGRKAAAAKRSKQRAPTIFYASRTHSQLAQVVAELKRCPPAVRGGVRMTILGARSQYCVNGKVLRKKGGLGLNEECRLLVDGGGCRYYKGQFSLRRRVEDLGLWDVEDVVALGKRHRGCPYYVSRELAASAKIVFCPYNYLLDPAIRKSLDLDRLLRGAAVVIARRLPFVLRCAPNTRSVVAHPDAQLGHSQSRTSAQDEGHNVEEVAREAASCSLELDALSEAADAMREVVDLGSTQLRSAHARLHALLESTRALLREEIGRLRDRDYKVESVDCGAHSYTGHEALVLFQQHANLESLTVAQAREAYAEAAAAAEEGSESDDESCAVGALTMPGGARLILDGLLSTLELMLAEGSRNARDFRMAICRRNPHKRAKQRGAWASRGARSARGGGRASVAGRVTCVHVR